MAENGARTAVGGTEAGSEGQDTGAVVATAECGVCAKPLVRRAVLTWQHADGNTYRHPIQPYFVRTAGSNAETRIARLLARCDDIYRADNRGDAIAGPGRIDVTEVRRLLTEEAPDA